MSHAHEAEPAERLQAHEKLSLVLNEIFLDRSTDLEIDSPRAGVLRVAGVFGALSPYGQEVGGHYIGLSRSKGLAPESEIYHLEAHPFDALKPSKLMEYHPCGHVIKSIECTRDLQSEPVVSNSIGIPEMLEFALQVLEAENSNRPSVAAAHDSKVDFEDIRFELQTLAA